MTQRMENASGYRWVVLLVYSIITVVIQMQWLTFAPIAREARIFYQATPLQIDLLSLVFMIAFLVVCIPASFVIDTYGIRIGIGIGGLLTGLFGVAKGIFATDYTLVLTCQVGLAVAQPFIINASTKVAMRWFPAGERATAVGLATLSQFVGVLIVMIATPFLIQADGEGAANLTAMLRIYGGVAAAATILLLLFLRERPSGDPGHSSTEAPFRFLPGLKHILALRDMQIVLLVFMVGLGAFNAISTCIDQICQIKGFSIEQTSMVGGILLAAGIIGGLTLPPLSDRLKRRKAFLVLAMAGIVPALIAMTVAVGYPMVLLGAFVFGFFLLGAGGPIGFQYSAEICRPAPESTSQGLILLVGQVSGILFVLGMNTVGVVSLLWLFVLLAIVSVGLCGRLTESEIE
jgi:MFS family permease